MTQAQEDAIQTALDAAKPATPVQGEKVKDEGHNKMKTVMDNLVSNGSMTQEREDAIQSALDAARPAALAQQAIQ